MLLDKLKVVAVTGVILVVVMGCNEKVGLGVGIIDFGEYSFDPGEQLHISNNEGVVKYILKDQFGAKLIESQDKASVYQKWVLVWDGNYLWFSSSDIGSVVWLKDDNGKYISKDINHSGNIRAKIPSEIELFINK